MVAHLEDIENLFGAVKSLRDERRKMQKLSDRAFQAEGPKASQKANVDLNWQAFHINKIEHAVHAAAVDCGYADLRSSEHYRTYSVKLTGFHEYEVVPAKPRSFKDGSEITSQLASAACPVCGLDEPHQHNTSEALELRGRRFPITNEEWLRYVGRTVDATLINELDMLHKKAVRLAPLRASGEGASHVL